MWSRHVVAKSSERRPRNLLPNICRGQKQAHACDANKASPQHCGTEQNSKEKTSEKCLEFCFFGCPQKRSPVANLFSTTLVFSLDEKRNSETTLLPDVLTSLRSFFRYFVERALCSPQLCTCTCKPKTHLHSDNTTRGGPVASSGIGTIWAVKLLGFGTLPGAVLLQLTPHRNVLGVARSPTNLISVIHDVCEAEHRSGRRGAGR